MYIWCKCGLIKQKKTVENEESEKGSLVRWVYTTSTLAVCVGRICGIAGLEAGVKEKRSETSGDGENMCV